MTIPARMRGQSEAGAVTSPRANAAATRVDVSDGNGEPERSAPLDAAGAGKPGPAVDDATVDASPDVGPKDDSADDPDRCEPARVLRLASASVTRNAQITAVIIAL